MVRVAVHYKTKLTLFLLVLSAIVWFLAVSSVSAHEAYVMDREAFWKGVAQPLDFRALDALKDQHNLILTAAVISGILLLILLNFLFRLSRPGRRIHGLLEKFSPIGPMFVRAAIAAAFFFSALTYSFLGPELPLKYMPFAEFLRWMLFGISIFITVGLFTEIAAFAALIIFTVGFFVFGSYLLTYFNYLGEIIALLFFGMRRWSLDAFIFGPLNAVRRRWERYETTIVRVFYGIALMFAGLTVKFLHPDLTIKVITDWNLTQFHWLFPRDPLLITLGAGLAEFTIGFFILVGFEMRIVVLISLFYITLSLIYFKELVWPHLMLYGISLNLLLQPEVLTLDHFLFNEHKKVKRWWKRLIDSHSNRTKSDSLPQSI